MSDERYRPLLWVALALAAIKFLLLPWLDHQATAAERLAVLTQRLDRSAGVIQNRAEIERALKEVEGVAILARKRFPDATDASAFRLGAQQDVSDIGAKSGLTLKIFEWILDGQAAGAGLEYSRARIQFEGGFKNLVTAQAGLETRFPNMVIREVTLGAATMISAPDQSLATLTVIADFYFRPMGAQVAK